MAKKTKDKRLTINQVYNQMQEMCEQMEEVATDTLKQEFGFGDKRKARFMKAFRANMSAYLLRQEKAMRKMNK